MNQIWAKQGWQTQTAWSSKKKQNPSFSDTLDTCARIQTGQGSPKNNDQTPDIQTAIICYLHFSKARTITTIAMLP